MSFFRNIRIKEKVTLVILLANLATLLLALLAVFTIQWFHMRDAISQDLIAQGEIIAANSSAALAFKDADTANETLAPLQSKRYILAAALYLPDSERLAGFGAAPPSLVVPSSSASPAFHHVGPHLALAQPVILKGRRVGALFLLFDFDDKQAEVTRTYLATLGIVFPLSLLLALLLSSSLQNVISKPIQELAHTAARISEQKDFSLRAPPLGSDELGALTTAFNEMLERIQEQDAALHHRLRMEKLVSEISARFIDLPVRQIDDGIRWALGAIGSFKEAEVAVVYLFAPDGKSAACAHRWTDLATGDEKPWPGAFEAKLYPWYFSMIQTRQAIKASGLADLPPEAQAERAMLASLGICSVAAVPMVFGERSIGFLSVACRKHPRQWGEDAVTVLDLVAQIVVSALERKRAGNELETIHAELVTASRQAGMAEVATGVLHNVGNVLNSVNVSTTLIHDRLRQSEVAALVKLAAVLKEHASDLPGFLTTSPRGKVVPAFIMQLADHLGQEHAALKSEHETVARNIEHIKEIVAMQQSYAKVSGVVERISLPELLEDALVINRAGLAQTGVAIQRDFLNSPPILADKHKILQILTNVVHNAKCALESVSRPDKQIKLIVRTLNGSRVQVVVQDNGIGIPRENLTRIFGHGFTTRKKGHGFGLHSGAIAAKEMGGSLQAMSEGPGAGATFILELPLKPEKTA